MDGLLDDVRAQLRAVFAGRSVILAGGVAAFSAQRIDQLRALGGERFLVLATGPGTGPSPEGPDVVVGGLLAEPPGDSDDSVAGFRKEERAVAQPAAAVLDAIRRFDPTGDAIVLAQPFLGVYQLGDRPLFGARRPEWVALEDKTSVDALFDAAGVPRPPSAVVAADKDAIERAAAALDQGDGTVWSGDARDGFNGSGARVRWVRDDADRDDALEHLVPRSDRVRVAAFAEGIPCSIHGFVVDDGVAVFRPVELVTLRAPSAPRLRFCGCATFFDPPPDHVAAMRTAATRIGEHLRSTVGFRGAFTLDGIAAAGGWVATECNPRFGAGLGYIDVVPELPLLMLHHAVVEGVADVPSAALGRFVVAAADRTRWGGTWTPVARVVAATTTSNVAGNADGFDFAGDDEPVDATLELGPSRAGGFVRLAFDAKRTPSGPPIAPRAAAALAFADRAFDLGLGPLAAARPVG